MMFYADNPPAIIQPAKKIITPKKELWKPSIPAILVGFGYAGAAGGGSSPSSSPPDSPASGFTATFRGGFTDSGVTVSTSINIGASEADKFCVMSIRSGNAGRTLSSVTVGGISLSPIEDGSNSSGQCFIYAGDVHTVSGSVTVSVTGSGFDFFPFDVWTITGLASTTVKQHAGAASGGQVMLSLDHGDFCPISYEGTGTFSTSTPEVPTQPGGSQFSYAYNPVATAGTGNSFTIQSGAGGGPPIAVASWA